MMPIQKPTSIDGVKNIYIFKSAGKRGGVNNDIVAGATGH